MAGAARASPSGSAAREPHPGDPITADELRRRVQASVEVDVWGTVQGVGFRPFVFRLATALGLQGAVRNRGSSVRIDLHGQGGAIARFLSDLVVEAPPAASVEGVIVRLGTPGAAQDFSIHPSTHSDGPPLISIPPDMAICSDCVRDLQDPGGRYYRYPFTSCTQCGPRYTIARRLPFDRGTTAMDRFPLCAPCEEDYLSPGSRRFHAQATACNGCGPHLRWLLPDGFTAAEGEDALRSARAALLAGGIVAVEGIGGFHLAANARDATAVEHLRERKPRPSKPLAVMMGEEDALHHCFADEQELRALRSRERPIVLLRRQSGSDLPEVIAPGMRRLGVLLPYSGIHLLLLEDPALACLVMTSANRSGEPLAHTVEQALEDLGHVADGFLVHDREILRPVDDSVVRLDAGDRTLIRRARGFVPEGFRVPPGARTQSALALGGDVKNAFAFLHDGRIWLGPHIGDLENRRTFESFRRQMDWYGDLLHAVPQIVVHDLHPGYHSTAYARSRPEDLLGVQHHHAHLAACLLEHGVREQALGVILDGMGYGQDGSIWGGELLLGGMASSKRVGHLRPLRLVGGDSATRQPWRLAVQYLHASGLWQEGGAWALARLQPPASVAQTLLKVLESRYSGALSTSAGRLFDAVAALAIPQGEASYEGELPMRLEGLVAPELAGSYPFPARSEDGALQIDFRKAVRGALRDLMGGHAPQAVATRFHRGLAHALAKAAADLCAEYGVRVVALGGGVWQNEWLLHFFAEALAPHPLEMVRPERFPPGDGGLAVGQLATLLAQPAGP